MTERRRTTLHGTTGQMRVFVNYRRGDTRHVAGRLRDLIVTRFGEDSVFVDVESIEPGLDYVTAIDTAVGSCQVMLVLIGDRWLEASNDRGLRRIDDPNDRLRLEIEAGLRHQTRVIPVLVDSASMPKSKDLPTPLAALARHQATRLRHESFRNDADHLLEVVERVVAGTSERDDPGREPGRPEANEAAARWLCLGSLVLAVLALIAFRAGVRDSLLTSRRAIPSEGPWVSLVWLLPALPILLAAWLVAMKRALGIALGCVAGATVWVGVSLAFVWRSQDAAILAHLLVLALMFAAMASLVISTPDLRARLRPNQVGRASAAVGFMVAAMALRVEASQIASALISDATPIDWSPTVAKPPFWIAALIPALICFPAALLLGNKVQASVLLTMAWLQVFYPVVVRAITFGSDVRKEDAATVIVENLVFLAGCGCIVVAVVVAQATARARNKTDAL